jgi:hypothetical protein
MKSANPVFQPLWGEDEMHDPTRSNTDLDGPVCLRVFLPPEKTDSDLSDHIEPSPVCETTVSQDHPPHFHHLQVEQSSRNSAHQRL